jgi:hypothetical protein
MAGAAARPPTRRCDAGRCCSPRQWWCRAARAPSTEANVLPGEEGHHQGRRRGHHQGRRWGRMCCRALRTDVLTGVEGVVLWGECAAGGEGFVQAARARSRKAARVPSRKVARMTSRRSVQGEVIVPVIVGVRTFFPFFLVCSDCRACGRGVVGFKISSAGWVFSPSL